MTNRGGAVRPKVVALVAAGSAVAFLTAAVSAQVPQGVVVAWWQPWLSPGVIIAAAGLILRSNESSRKKTEAQFNELGRNVRDVSERLGRVEQELVGYDGRSGALGKLRHIEEAIDTDSRRRHDLGNLVAAMQAQMTQVGMWAVELGAKVGVPFDRRSLTRRPGEQET